MHRLPPQFWECLRKENGNNTPKRCKRFIYYRRTAHPCHAAFRQSHPERFCLAVASAVVRPSEVMTARRRERASTTASAGGNPITSSGGEALTFGTRRRISLGTLPESSRKSSPSLREA